MTRKRRKPREWWVILLSGGAIWNVYSTRDEAYADHCDDEKIVRVREVLPRRRRKAVRRGR